MQGKKIESLNFAMHECIPAMQSVANENPHAQLLVRAICFSDIARWNIAQPTDIHTLKWLDIDIDANRKSTIKRRMGLALSEVAKVLDVKNMPERGLPPVLVLMSDGQPTDDFNTGLNALLDQPWGAKSVRIALPIGEDADHIALQKFTENSKRVLAAANMPEILKLIRWSN